MNCTDCKYLAIIWGMWICEETGVSGKDNLALCPLFTPVNGEIIPVHDEPEVV